MSSNTNVICEIDLNHDGRHGGFIRIPHSVHRSAYGWIPVPIISIRNGAGPTVLLLGGNHGDEFEGQVALAKLAQNLPVDQLTGQIIVLPMANYPAAHAGMRTSPVDDGNLNRSFPGQLSGSPTEMIAHYIESALMSRTDYMLDIHSGGSSMRYRQPTLLVSRFVNQENTQQLMALVHALGFPRAIEYSDSRGAGYSTSAARRQGALGITAEMAGGGTVDSNAMKLLQFALPRFLATCGLYHGPVEPTESPTEFFSIHPQGSYLYAHTEGIFESADLPNDQAIQDEIAGWIHYPDVPLTKPIELRFQHDGIVMSSRIPARVERGDCLFEIGMPSDYEFDN